MNQKTVRNVTSGLGNRQRMRMGRGGGGGGGRGEDEDVPETCRNVTSGLGNRHVEWGQPGEKEGERNKTRCEGGEEEDVPEHRAERHIRSGQQVREMGSAWRG